MEYEMKFSEAVKKLPAKTKEETFMLLDISYDLKLVLPYKKGLLIAEALEDAMQYKERYSDPPMYQPVGESITFRQFSTEELQLIKVAQLLRISLSDARRMKEYNP